MNETQLFAFVILPIAMMIGGGVTVWVHPHNLAKRDAKRPSRLARTLNES